MPISGGMGDWGSGIASGLANVGAAVGGSAGGDPGAAGRWYRGAAQQSFESLPKSRQFGHLKSLLIDNAAQVGRKMSDKEASQTLHGYIRGITDPAISGGKAMDPLDAYAALRKALADTRDKVDPNAPKHPFSLAKSGESVLTPDVAPSEALNRGNVAGTFRDLLDPNAPYDPNNPAQVAGKGYLTSNVGYERLGSAMNRGIFQQTPESLMTGLQQVPGVPPGTTLASPVTRFRGGGKGAAKPRADDPAMTSNILGQGGQIPFFEAEAFKNTVPGQVGQAESPTSVAGKQTPSGPDYNMLTPFRGEPSKAYPETVASNVFRQNVVQPYADQQRDVWMQLADAYDTYIQHKGEKGFSNPLTAYKGGPTAADLGPGPITGDTIRQAAIEKWGDGQTPGWWMTDPTQQKSLVGTLTTNVGRKLAKVKQGMSKQQQKGIQRLAGGPSLAWDLPRWLSQIGYGRFPTGAEDTAAAVDASQSGFDESQVFGQ